MGKKDVEEKEYFNDTIHFADVCNGILFKGRQRILPQELEEAGEELLFSDKRMNVSIRVDGMRKEDKFIPVILIVINWSGEKWSGATTLYEMLQLPDELMPFVNNYKLNIFDYHDNEDFSVFKTEVRVIFEALKNADNEKKMATVFERFPSVERETVQLIETLLNIKFDNKYITTNTDGKEVIDMCKAWEDHFNNGKREGIEQGIEQTLLLFVQKKINKKWTLDMIAEDLEEDIELIRPIYEKAKAQL